MSVDKIKTMQIRSDQTNAMRRRKRSILLVLTEKESGESEGGNTGDGIFLASCKQSCTHQQN